MDFMEADEKLNTQLVTELDHIMAKLKVSPDRLIHFI